MCKWFGCVTIANVNLIRVKSNTHTDGRAIRNLNQEGLSNTNSYIITSASARNKEVEVKRKKTTRAAAADFYLLVFSEALSTESF